MTFNPRRGFRLVKKPSTESNTIARLRRKLREVTTRAQLEAIIRAGDPETIGARRRLIESLAPQGLPCCGVAMLCKAKHRPIEHLKGCPDGGLVVIQ